MEGSRPGLPVRRLRPVPLDALELATQDGVAREAIVMLD
jgi:hypothetical protein